MPVAGLPAFVPDWRLPPGVGALQTECGVGLAPFGGFNVGNHVGDDAVRVLDHRHQLAQAIDATPVWLSQMHGSTVHRIDVTTGPVPEADAAWTSQRGCACAIITADCLPVLIADRDGRVVGAAHAGWRGLAAGVVQQLVQQMRTVPDVSPNDLTVWLGPAIGPAAFEVGPDVIDTFAMLHAGYRRAFTPHPQSAGKYLGDLAALARMMLRELGIEDVIASGLCTVSQPERFYSYRRDGVTGRMASLIWLN